MSDFRLGDLIQAIDENKEAMNVQLTGSIVEVIEETELTVEGSDNLENLFVISKDVHKKYDWIYVTLEHVSGDRNATLWVIQRNDFMSDYPKFQESFSLPYSSPIIPVVAPDDIIQIRMRSILGGDSITVKASVIGGVGNFVNDFQQKKHSLVFKRNSVEIGSEDSFTLPRLDLANFKFLWMAVNSSNSPFDITMRYRDANNSHTISQFVISSDVNRFSTGYQDLGGRFFNPSINNDLAESITVDVEVWGIR